MNTYEFHRNGWIVSLTWRREQRWFHFFSAGAWPHWSEGKRSAGFRGDGWQFRFGWIEISKLVIRYETGLERRRMEIFSANDE
jgi:hypothetical protein